MSSRCCLVVDPADSSCLVDVTCQLEAALRGRGHASGRARPYIIASPAQWTRGRDWARLRMSRARPSAQLPRGSSRVLAPPPPPGLGRSPEEQRSTGARARRVRSEQVQMPGLFAYFIEVDAGPPHLSNSRANKRRRCSSISFRRRPQAHLFAPQMRQAAGSTSTARRPMTTRISEVSEGGGKLHLRGNNAWLTELTHTEGICRAAVRTARRRSVYGRSTLGHFMSVSFY